MKMSTACHLARLFSGSPPRRRLAADTAHRHRGNDDFQAARRASARWSRSLRPQFVGGDPAVLDALGHHLVAGSKRMGASPKFRKGVQQWINGEAAQAIRRPVMIVSLPRKLVP